MLKLGLVSISFCDRSLIWCLSPRIRSRTFVCGFHQHHFYFGREICKLFGLSILGWAHDYQIISSSIIIEPVHLSPHAEFLTQKTLIQSRPQFSTDPKLSSTKLPHARLCCCCFLLVPFHGKTNDEQASPQLTRKHFTPIHIDTGSAQVF